MISSLFCSEHLNVPRVVFKITADDRPWYLEKKNPRVFRLTECDCAQCYSLRTAAKQTQDKR